MLGRGIKPKRGRRNEGNSGELILSDASCGGRDDLSERNTDHSVYRRTADHPCVSDSDGSAHRSGQSARCSWTMSMHKVSLQCGSACVPSNENSSYKPSHSQHNHRDELSDDGLDPGDSCSKDQEILGSSRHHPHRRCKQTQNKKCIPVKLARVGYGKHWNLRVSGLSVFWSCSTTLGPFGLLVLETKITQIKIFVRCNRWVFA